MIRRRNRGRPPMQSAPASERAIPRRRWLRATAVSSCPERRRSDARARRSRRQPPSRATRTSGAPAISPRQPSKEDSNGSAAGISATPSATTRNASLRSRCSKGPGPRSRRAGRAACSRPSGRGTSSTSRSNASNRGAPPTAGDPQRVGPTRRMRRVPSRVPARRVALSRSHGDGTPATLKQAQRASFTLVRLA